MRTVRDTTDPSGRLTKRTKQCLHTWWVAGHTAKLDTHLSEGRMKADYIHVPRAQVLANKT
jgi:hypothetical protein